MSSRIEQTSEKKIETVTVIGAGTMGAAIAGHLANVGLKVYLLDIAPTTLTSQESAAGLALTDRQVRNRIVEAGFARMIKARPSNLFADEIAQQIHLGNLEDDLGAALLESDWIIEAIVEQLQSKQTLMARIESLAPATAIISTNTSGIPIRQISTGRNKAFQERFLGIHFFNPPRYLPLVEIIPTPATNPAITKQMRAFVEETLGKNVVICHDTPNFIANRMISYIMADLIAFAVDNGYSVEEVDSLTGPLMGRPRSATFRLNDIVGIDVWAMIARNLYPLIPDDKDRELLIAPSYLNLLQTLVDQGHMGTKSGQGFYQTKTAENGEKSFWALDLNAAAAGEIHYVPPQNPAWPEVDAVQRQPLADRLAALVTLPDRAGLLIWHTLSHTLVYAAAHFPEIANSLSDIDHAMEWGFAWELGPFAIWDALGVEATTERMAKEGLAVPEWVHEMITQGHSSFYRLHNGTRQVYHPPTGDYVEIEQDSRAVSMATLKAQRSVLIENAAATLLDTGEGVLLLEFHSKMNTLDNHLFPILQRALDEIYGNATGLLIANNGPHFSLGANLKAMLASAEEDDWKAIDRLIAQGQELFLALRAAPRPVVAAPFQRVLGGGAEICLASHQVVAHAETNVGLVEFNVGLIPGWGGCKEMVRRHVQPQAPLPALRHIMKLVTQARVSSSAVEAKAMGLLAMEDRVVMHRDHLIHVGRERIAQLAVGWTSLPIKGNVYAAGPEAFAALQADIETTRAEEKFLAHDVTIATALAQVITGGDRTGWRNEQDFLDLERQHFMQLIHTPSTHARIRQVLATGKPLRN